MKNISGKIFEKFLAYAVIGWLLACGAWIVAAQDWDTTQTYIHQFGPIRAPGESLVEGLYSTGDIKASTSTITANKFVGDGSGLTNIGASQIPDLSGTYLPLSGETMSGNLNMGGNDITNAVKVGIGTTTPNYSLDVNGVINSSSYIKTPNHFDNYPITGGGLNKTDALILLCPYGGGSNECIGNIYGQRSSGAYGGRNISIIYSSQSTNTTPYTAYLEIDMGTYGGEDWTLVTADYSGTTWVAVRYTGIVYWHTDLFFDGYTRGYNTSNPFECIDTNSATNVTELSYNSIKEINSQYVNIDGNLGIGIENPYEKLEIDGNVAIKNNSCFIDRNLYLNCSGDSLAYIIGGNSYPGTENIKFDTTNHDIDFTAGGNTMLELLGDENRVQANTDITTSGNVGIGTNSPSAPLDISVTTETAIEFDNGDALITIHDGFGNFNFKSGVDDDNIITRGAGGSHIRMDDTGAIYLTIDESTAVGGTFSKTAELVVDAGRVSIEPQLYVNGSTGIGTTSPRAGLDVAGSIITDWNNRFFGTWYSDGSAYRLGFDTTTADRKTNIHAYSSDGNGNITFSLGTVGAPSEKMRIDTNGNVGIGTSTPQYGKLEVKPNLNNADTGITLYSGAGNTGRSWLDSSYNWLMTRGTSPTAGICIANSPLGYVGIGTTAPAALLHVAGSATFNGNIYLDYDDGGIGYVVGGSSTSLGEYITFDTANNDIKFTAGGNTMVELLGDEDRFRFRDTRVNYYQSHSWHMPTDSSVYSFNNIASFYKSGSSTDGVIIIKLGAINPRNMVSVKIKGFDYSTTDAGGWWEVDISGYTLNGSWYTRGMSANIHGGAPFSRVRLGFVTATSEPCIQLGTIGDTFSYSRVWLSEIIATYGTVSSDWGNGATIIWETDDTTNYTWSYNKNPARANFSSGINASENIVIDTADKNFVTAGDLYLNTDRSGGGNIVFGPSTSDGEYIRQSGNDLSFYAGGSQVMVLDGDQGDADFTREISAEHIVSTDDAVIEDTLSIGRALYLDYDDNDSAALYFGNNSSDYHFHKVLGQLKLNTGNMDLVYFDAATGCMSIGGGSSNNSELEVHDDIYAHGSVSALSFTDRCEVPLNSSKSIDLLRNIKPLNQYPSKEADWLELDHDSLPAGVLEVATKTIREYEIKNRLSGEVVASIPIRILDNSSTSIRDVKDILAIADIELPDETDFDETTNQYITVPANPDDYEYEYNVREEVEKGRNLGNQVSLNVKAIVDLDDRVTQVENTLMGIINALKDENTKLKQDYNNLMSEHVWLKAHAVINDPSEVIGVPGYKLKQETDILLVPEKPEEEGIFEIY
ncbi:MAG: hypothetical protein JXR73_19980 [Candidatus Omnitrophica bacterium]|nr:hypothetical protein [Candidatus Omnitrophota bacterium]